MYKKPLFWETFFVLFLVAALNFIAMENHLYWSTNEFDSLLHFLGGVFVSLFFIWFYFFSGHFHPKSRDFKSFLKISFLGMVFVGVLWEAYELLIGEAQYSGSNYSYDTTLDFIMDFLGAIAGMFYGYMKETNDKIIKGYREPEHE